MVNRVEVNNNRVNINNYFNTIGIRYNNIPYTKFLG